MRAQGAARDRSGARRRGSGTLGLAHIDCGAEPLPLLRWVRDSECDPYFALGRALAILRWAGVPRFGPYFAWAEPLPLLRWVRDSEFDPYFALGRALAIFALGAGP